LTALWLIVTARSSDFGSQFMTDYRPQLSLW
jgi:hypothetical protein